MLFGQYSRPSFRILASAPSPNFGYYLFNKIGVLLITSWIVAMEIKFLLILDNEEKT